MFRKEKIADTTKIIDLYKRSYWILSKQKEDMEHMQEKLAMKKDDEIGTVKSAAQKEIKTSEGCPQRRSK